MTGNTRLENDIANLIADHYPTRTSAIACRPSWVCRCGAKLESVTRWGHHVQHALTDFLAARAVQTGKAAANG